MARPSQTHCRRGHPLSDANVHHVSRGNRMYTLRDCRTCHRFRARLHRRGLSAYSYQGEWPGSVDPIRVNVAPRSHPHVLVATRYPEPASNIENWRIVP